MMCVSRCLKARRPGFQQQSAIYRDFRAGDIHHSNADISKAQKHVKYLPTHDIYQGMAEAIEWYIERCTN